MAARKAALLEGKNRREERTKAVAKRSASVVRLMELESDRIRLEKEAVVSRVELTPVRVVVTGELFETVAASVPSAVLAAPVGLSFLF